MRNRSVLFFLILCCCLWTVIGTADEDSRTTIVQPSHRLSAISTGAIGAVSCAGLLITTAIASSGGGNFAPTSGYFIGSLIAAPFMFFGMAAVAGYIENQEIRQAIRILREQGYSDEQIFANKWEFVQSKDAALRLVRKVEDSASKE